MLEEEFLRAGIDSKMEEKKLVDIQNIFHKMEKKNIGSCLSVLLS